ncbi:MAG: copper amine oxidase N-terminal domain-containing protein [Tissierellia bacterium]|nr:copper amine oxidase N-terminal domain-containing protein [Tissierellia bacterium]
MEILKEDLLLPTKGYQFCKTIIKDRICYNRVKINRKETDIEKISLSLSLLFVIMLSTPVSAKDISIYINNQKIETPDVPYIKADRTLVPIRVISENLGVSVDWDNDKKEVLLQKDANNIILPVGKNVYIHNGKEKNTDIAPELKNDRTFVPLRLVAELYGKQVNWDQDSYSVFINNQGTEVIIPKTAQT